jgi:hypothetical protein
VYARLLFLVVSGSIDCFDVADMTASLTPLQRRYWRLPLLSIMDCQLAIAEIQSAGRGQPAAVNSDDADGNADAPAGDGAVGGGGAHPLSHLLTLHGGKHHQGRGTNRELRDLRAALSNVDVRVRPTPARGLNNLVAVYDKLANQFLGSAGNADPGCVGVACQKPLWFAAHLATLSLLGSDLVLEPSAPARTVQLQCGRLRAAIERTGLPLELQPRSDRPSMRAYLNFCDGLEV